MISVLDLMHFLSEMQSAAEDKEDDVERVVLPSPQDVAVGLLTCDPAHTTTAYRDFTLLGLAALSVFKDNKKKKKKDKKETTTNDKCITHMNCSKVARLRSWAGDVLKCYNMEIVKQKKSSVGSAPSFFDVEVWLGSSASTSGVLNSTDDDHSVLSILSQAIDRKALKKLKQQQQEQEHADGFNVHFTKYLQARVGADYLNLIDWTHVAVMHSKERLPFRVRLAHSQKDYLVKQHDDLRQEYIVMLIQKWFNEKWKEDQPPQPPPEQQPEIILLRTYEIVPCCRAEKGGGGYVEFIPNAISLHDLIKQDQTIEETNNHNTNNNNNYVRSFAASSAMNYVLRITDRHNANIMVDTETRQLFHVDFAFCFERAPGGMFSVETAPFKAISRNIVEQDPIFHETFRQSMVLLYKHCDELCCFLEFVFGMCPDLSCLDHEKPHNVVKAVRKRIHEGATSWRRLIEDSLADNGAKMYDEYQLKTNGILH
eukprot:PhM_4_TR8272/c0_g1_i1/m.35910/K19801/PI4KB; phosphatidylinositol 4-kinase B